MIQTHSIGPRRLSAIFFADVVGYSWLMGIDEEATYSAISDHIQSIESKCKDYDGKIIEVRGDGILALFDSVVSAVQFAVDFQRVVEEKNTEVVDDRRIEFRIGINLGDVILADAKIVGESVNIAARIESLARAGGICISGAVYEQVRNKLHYGYEYLGPKKLKNIRNAVDIYRVTDERVKAIMAPSLRLRQIGVEMEQILPKRPSVALLPLENLKVDPAEDYLSDGITEDITTNLSKFHDLFVIASGSSSTYKGEHFSVQQAGRQLGVRYLAKGSVRKADNRIRISVQLVDAENGHYLWAERYDRELTGIFKIQDEIAQTIASVLGVQIEKAELNRLRTVEPSDIEAYGLLLRGQQRILRYRREDNRKARQFYKAALDLDVNYARACASISRTYNFEWRYSWARSPQEALEKAFGFARAAAELDEYDARGHAELGFVHLYRKEHDLSVSSYERALELNPNDADIMAELADSFAHSGRSEESIELFNKAMRLNPFYPDHYLWKMGGAYYNLKAYEEVIDVVRRMHNPTEGYRLLAASYAQLGKIEKARFCAEKVMEAHPHFSLKHWRTVLPDKNPDETEHFLEGLRKAGLR